MCLGRLLFVYGIVGMISQRNYIQRVGNERPFQVILESFRWGKKKSLMANRYVEILLHDSTKLGRVAAITVD